jgi:hypothetical protein
MLPDTALPNKPGGTTNMGRHKRSRGDELTCGKIFCDLVASASVVS